MGQCAHRSSRLFSQRLHRQKNRSNKQPQKAIKPIDRPPIDFLVGLDWTQSLGLRSWIQYRS